MKNSTNNLHKILSTALSLMLGIAGLCAPANAAPLKELKNPNRNNQRRAMPLPPYQPDILLVAQDPKADGDEITDTLKDLHGTAVNQLRFAKPTFLVILTG